MTKYFTKQGDEFKEVESFSEEMIDEISGDKPWLTSRLERARENERKKFADYDDLKKKADAVDTIKSEFETKLTEATTKVGTLETELTGAKLATDKVKIMNEFKLPEDMDEFVVGNTVEEMRTRAEKLSKGIKPSKVVIEKTPRPGDEDATESKKLAGKLFGKKSDD